MVWLASSIFALVSLGVSVVTYTLTKNIAPQPEYPMVMTRTMRLIGFAITVTAAVFGLLMFWYAGLEYDW